MSLEEQAARLKWNERDRLLREVKLPTVPKLILCILNSHIGSGTLWTMPLSKLASEAGIHKKTLKANIMDLEEACLMSAEATTGTTGTGELLYEFRLCWGNVLELPRCGEDGETIKRKHAKKRSGTPSPQSTDPPRKVPNPSPQSTDPLPAKSNRSSYKRPIEHPMSAPGGLDKIPPNLQTPEFIESWNQWRAFRKKKRKPISDWAANRQLKVLSEAGQDQAIAAIDESIRNDWQGLFPNRSSPNAKPESPGDRIDRLISEAEERERNPEIIEGFGGFLR